MPSTRAPTKGQLIEEALAVAAKYLQDGKTYTGVSNEAREADEQQEKRIRKLKKELEASKRAVVDHLHRKRYIERKIIAVTNTEANLRSHVRDKAMVEDNQRAKMAADANDPLKRRTLDVLILTTIEAALQLRPGTASMVQEFLETYDDSNLSVELSRIPDAVRKGLDKMRFGDIAVHTSSRYLSRLDGEEMFVMSRMGGRRADNRWEKICRRFRKKLFRVHLARELVLKDKLMDSVSQPEILLTSKTPMSSKLGSSSGGLGGSRVSVSRMSMSSSTGSLGDVASGADGMHNAVMKLQMQLRHAQSKQQGHKDSIISNLSTLTKTVPLSAEKHGSAWEFSKRMGARKLEGIIRRKALHLLRQAMSSWQDIVELYRSEERCTKTSQVIAMVRLTRFLDEIFHSKLKRGFRKLHGIIRDRQNLEYDSAAVEMQRVVRGLLGQRRVYNLIRYNAAVQIQRLGRGKLSKLRVMSIKREIELRGAVHIVEAAYKKHVWLRTLKKIRIVKMRHNMATRIQALYRGHIGRRSLRARWRKFYRKKGATKMQALFRRYQACVYVDWYRKNRRRILAVTVIQKYARRMNAINFVTEYRELNMYAGRIGRFMLVRFSIWRVQRWRLYVNARKIQRLQRGFVARKRVFKLRNAQVMAQTIIYKICYGYYSRIVWGPVFKDFYFKRANAANVIKIQLMKAVIEGRKARRRWKEIQDALVPIYHLVRRFLEKLRNEEERKAKFHWASSTIQRHWRGIWGRERACARRIEWEKEEALRKRPPAYYRLKEDYYKEQNLFHKPYVIKIQCAQRCMWAWKRVDFLRRSKNARIIQAKARDFLAMKEAMRELKRRIELKRKRNAAALDIQRLARGRQGRYEAAKHGHAEIVKWYIHEANATGMVGKALMLFRIRKKNLERANRMAVRIQALIRSFLGRAWLRQNFKRLVREKKKRAEIKRHRMATRMQCLVRVAQAKVRFQKKVIEFEEINRERAELDALEARLGDIHEEHLNDLLATRVQTGARSTFAKSAYARKKEAAKASAEKKKNDALFRGAQLFQGLVRGMIGRKKFKANLAFLQREKQLRAFCVECESVIAVRRCRICRDRYCAACFEKIHKKGNRQKHGYDLIVDERKKKKVGGGDGSSGPGGKKGGKKGGPGAPDAPKEKKIVWEEYMDDQMQAKYWFNAETGEATWIPPPGFS